MFLGAGFDHAPAPVPPPGLASPAARALTEPAPQATAGPSAPVPAPVAATGSAVSGRLEEFFGWDGEPLVLKSGNGLAFTAEATGACLAAQGVIPHLSPPGRPEYNGAREAGIGALKGRAASLAEGPRLVTVRVGIVTDPA